MNNINNVSTPTPVVSACVRTYNNEKYIREVLESLLRQNFTLPMEIIVGDDSSSDNTIKIVNQYCEKYPDIIKLYESKKNCGIGANFSKTFLKCRGKYVWYIDGDDYIIDNNILYKQYQFLESNNEFVGVGVRNVAFDSDTGKELYCYPEETQLSRTITLNDFLSGINYPCTGTLFRNIAYYTDGRREIELIPEISQSIDDLSICIMMSKHGGIMIMPDKAYAYRVVRKEGASNYNSLLSKLTRYQQHIELLNNIYMKYDETLKLSVRYHMVLDGMLLYCLKNRKIEEFWRAYRSIPPTIRNSGQGNLLVETFINCIKLLIRKK